MFIFIDIGFGLGCAGLTPLCDVQETSWIASINDYFVKASIDLIYNSQYMTLSKIVTDTAL
jgi:hypothetical protein